MTYKEILAAIKSVKAYYDAELAELEVGRQALDCLAEVADWRKAGKRKNAEVARNKKMREGFDCFADIARRKKAREVKNLRARMRRLVNRMAAGP